MCIDMDDVCIFFRNEISIIKNFDEENLDFR